MRKIDIILRNNFIIAHDKQYNIIYIIIKYYLYCIYMYDNLINIRILKDCQLNYCCQFQSLNIGYVSCLAYNK